MKKYLSLIIAGIAALFAVSCAQDELVMFDASKATAPVLQSYVVTDDDVTVDFTPGSFGQSFNTKMPVNHSIILKTVNGEAVGNSVPSALKDGKLVVTVTNLSKALIALGYEEGQKVALEMVIRASMQETARDNGVNGFVESAGVIGIPDYEVFLPSGDPYARYTDKSPWGLVGSFNNWGDGNSDFEMWTNGTLHVAKLVELSAGDEVKFRKDFSWDVNYGYAEGVDSYTLDEEFALSPGGPNIKIAESGVYYLVLDPENAKATIIAASTSDEQLPDIDFSAYEENDAMGGAETWGIIGPAVLDWSTDVDLEKVSDNPEIWVGKNIPFQGDKFKFRGNDEWADYDLGGAEFALDTPLLLSKGGSDISATAGVYNVYLYPTYMLVYITEGSGDVPPPPEKPKVWSLIGTLNGTGWDTDFDMTNTSGDTWVIRSVKFTASDEFKIRADHDWGTNVGGPEENSQSTIDPTNVYGVYKPEVGKVFEAGDKNIQIGVEGLYDVTFDYAAKTILIEEHIAAYSLIGNIEGTEWNQDFVMKEKDGVWTSEVVKINGGFKVRYDYSWADENTYGMAEGAEPQVGTAFTLVQPGSDIKLAEGSYKVQFTPATKEILITAVNYPEHLYMVGQDFGGWDWGSDDVVELVPVVHNPDWSAYAEGQFWTVRYFKADSGFKFNSVRDWNGTQFGKLETNEGFTNDGDENLHVPSDGLYMVHIDLKNGILHVEPARVFGIGPCFGGWTSEMTDAQFQADGQLMKAVTADEGELRMYVASAIATSDWWTREFIILAGKIDYRGDDEGQGDQERVKVLKGQVVTLDFNAGTGTITGEGEVSDKPTAWSLIGTLDGSSWDKDFDLENTSGDLWVIKKVAVTASDEFKIRANHDWAKSVGGPEANDHSIIDETNPYDVYKPEIGKAFEAGDKNIRIGVEGTYTVTFDYKANTILIEEYKEFPNALYMIGQDFGGWDWGSDGVVELIPVLHHPDWGADAPGQFWTIRYFKADSGFKFNSAKAWDGGQFGKLETNEGFTNDGDENLHVPEDGLYLVHIDLKKGILHVEKARVYGIGDCFGGWDEGMEAALFTASEGKLTGKTAAAGKLRMYVASSISTSPWWTRELGITDGKLICRGNGGDLADNPVEAGKTITLDFNAGTAVVE